jgi:hypothetical protein
VHHGSYGSKQGLGATSGNGNIGIGIYMGTICKGHFIGYGLPKLWGTGHVRILVEPLLNVPL